MTTLDSEAGKPRPETTRRHDPDVNRRFIAIMDDPDLADFVRGVNVGLPANDAPRPQEVTTAANAAAKSATAAPGTAATTPRHLPRRIEKDAVVYRDRDGDTVSFRRIDDTEKGLHGYLIDVNGAKAFMEDAEDGDAVVEWLVRRMGGTCS